MKAIMEESDYFWVNGINFVCTSVIDRDTVNSFYDVVDDKLKNLDEDEFAYKLKYSYRDGDDSWSVLWIKSGYKFIKRLREKVYKIQAKKCYSGDYFRSDY